MPCGTWLIIPKHPQWYGNWYGSFAYRSLIMSYFINPAQRLGFRTSELFMPDASSPQGPIDLHLTGWKAVCYGIRLHLLIEVTPHQIEDPTQRMSGMRENVLGRNL